MCEMERFPAVTRRKVHSFPSLNGVCSVKAYRYAGVPRTGWRLKKSCTIILFLVPPPVSCSDFPRRTAHGEEDSDRPFPRIPCSIQLV